MTTHNIFAYTSTKSPFPEYVSINDENGQVKITVRGSSKDGNEGSTSTMMIETHELGQLKDALAKYLEGMD